MKYYVAYNTLDDKIEIVDFPTRLEMVTAVKQMKELGLEILCVWVENEG